MKAKATIADTIIAATQSVTKQWAKQRKSEERSRSSTSERSYRLMRVRRPSMRDIAFRIMERVYKEVSKNGTLPANARQLFYRARPTIQEESGRKLKSVYFTQILLPDYIEENDREDWDIVYDDRGHFTEPHTGRMFGLGTLNVRAYLNGNSKHKFSAPALVSGGVSTHGPDGCYSAIVFVEKEGFAPLLKHARIAERYDIAIASSKGMSVTALRQLADEMAGDGIPLLVLHDFDKSGFSIIGTLRRDTRRYQFVNEPNVIDIGLRLADIEELGVGEDYWERVSDRGDEYQRAGNLRENGATEKEIRFLLRRRVEISALTSDQLIRFIEAKLQKHGIKKLIPAKAALDEAYRQFRNSMEIERLIRMQMRKLKNGSRHKSPVPKDLSKRVAVYLKNNSAIRWDAALSDIARSELKGSKHK